jgi:RNA polymerase-binding transcription factor DksA
MDDCDEALRLSEIHLADCLRRRDTVHIHPGAGGTCAVCGDPIPPARLATGAGTCIHCQLGVEQGRL